MCAPRVPGQEDMLLRAVRFLDTMLQRDSLQKAAFLKDLAGLWPRVDARVLKFRLLPPLLAEARCAPACLQPHSILVPISLSCCPLECSGFPSTTAAGPRCILPMPRASAWLLCVTTSG